MRLPEGFLAGHWTNAQAGTGCTVILCPSGTRGSGEVRGNSPGSRELALLAPEKSMQQVDAVLLTGGSAYGLAAADGVMRWLRERQRGYETPWGRVPIVPAAVVFDLNQGQRDVWPGADAGYAACDAAAESVEEGAVGAGAGTTVGKWNGIEFAMKSGVGGSTKMVGDLVVTALAIVNAVGDVVGSDGKILAGALGTGKTFLGGEQDRTPARGRVLESGNTTLVAVMTNADLSKLDLFRVAQRMHDGMARAIVPSHTSYDGDVTFALAHGSAKADLDLVAETGAQVTAEAIRRSVAAGS